MDDEVMVDVTIEISTTGVVNTGYTVAAWNALSRDKRDQIVTSMWTTEATSHDNGGMSVVTPGATEI